ncbi:MAG: DUF421 domain-containing protein [Oscillospiraceae bacterium]
MEYLRVALSALCSIIVLFLLAKIMGSRQISQLSFFDYINGITIGSIAAEFALCGGKDFLPPLIAMTVYALAAALISIATNKSIKLRVLVEGKPLIIFEKGKILDRNLAHAKLDINEFLMHARYEGYFDLCEIETAVLETNGKISFLPKSSDRPATPKDLNLTPEKSEVLYNVVIDGKILEDCLKNAGKNEKWLMTNLALEGVGLEEVMLATCGRDNELTVYERQKKDDERKIFI